MAAACTNSDYELENLVPDEYHKILYINNSGTQDLTLYNTGSPNTYEISVYKGGSDPAEMATAEIRIHSQAEVDELYSAHDDVDYVIIPEGSYSLDMQQVNFASSDRYKVVTVSLMTETIEAEMDANPDKTYVLPIYLTSDVDSVNVDKDELFIRMTDVLTPTLGFSSTDAQSLSFTYGFAPDTVSANFRLDVENTEWDIDCTFAVDADYVADYNAANGTSYALLPEGTYTLTNTLTLSLGTTEMALPVVVDGSSLTPGDYILPLRMTDVSFFSVSESRSICPMIIRVIGTEFDRSGWTVEANTEERTGEGPGNGVAECMLDGNLSTFWHSQWQSGSVPLPHEIVVDTKKTVTFTNIGLQQRQHDSYRDVNSGDFYVSSDNVNWTPVGSFQAQKVLENQIFTITPTQGRYFKIVIRTSNRESASALSEVYAYGIE